MNLEGHKHMPLGIGVVFFFFSVLWSSGSSAQLTNAKVIRMNKVAKIKISQITISIVFEKVWWAKKQKIKM